MDLLTSQTISDQTNPIKWDVLTENIEIPNGIPINAPFSPEELKDIATLFDSPTIVEYKDQLLSYYSRRDMEDLKNFK